jgi:hypothetical protein
METVRTSETSVYLYEATRRYIPEGCHLRIIVNSFAKHVYGAKTLRLIPLHKTLYHISCNKADGTHNKSENGRGAWVTLCGHPSHTDTDTVTSM